jgi:hypothetical protein
LVQEHYRAASTRRDEADSISRAALGGLQSALGLTPLPLGNANRLGRALHCVLRIGPDLREGAGGLLDIPS